MSKLTVFTSLIVAGLLLSACTRSGTRIGAQNWTTHDDPLGFSVETPREWEVSNEEGRITIAGPNAERVTIYPLRVEGRLDAKRAQHLMVGLSGQLRPGQRWKMPKGGWQFGANGVRAIGADESELRETTALWWANTGEGATGFFYAVGARPERFEATEVVFARILESFRVTEANGEGGGESERGQHRGASGPLAGLEFQRWTDPAERSFSVEVPAGWHMSGGLRRAGTTSKLIEVVAQSPDGQIVRSGDVRIPYQFITPNETLARLGYGEGQLYPGTSTLILSFMPALDFASNYYVRGYVAKICSNIQFTSQRDRPDYIQKLGSQGLLLERNQYTAGEVIYTCELNGKPYVGYLFVETKALPTQGLGDMWNVQRLDGFLAPADRATQADAVLQRMVASFDFDAQWWAAETNGDIQIKEDQRRYREFSAKLQQQTQNERWASWDRRTEQTGDILRGQTRVVDPESGQAYKVEHTSNYYWVDTKHDVIAGTNIPYKPTWDFREMVQTYR